MKAISLWQPWASLIVAGIKPYETRGWGPPTALIGQRIAIHAAKMVDKDAIGLAQRSMLGERGAALEATWRGAPDEIMAHFGRATMPVGCIVGSAILRAAFRLGAAAEGTAVPARSIVERRTRQFDPFPPCFTVRVDELGDYREGRWAWLMEDARPSPPMRRTNGRQKFFDVPDA